MQHLTKDELTKLLAAAKSESHYDWMMILVAFWHGLRATEICELTAEQVRDGYISVQRLKGSLKTTQPLVRSDDPLLDEKQPLEDWASFVGTGRLFTIDRKEFWRKMQRYGKAAGLPKHKSHPHVLKHTTAMLTIKSAGIENVRAYLGHKSIASTGAYLKVDDETASKAITAAIGE